MKTLSIFFVLTTLLLVSVLTIEAFEVEKVLAGNWKVVETRKDSTSSDIKAEGPFYLQKGASEHSLFGNYSTGTEYLKIELVGESATVGRLSFAKGEATEDDSEAFFDSTEQTKSESLYEMDYSFSESFKGVQTSEGKVFKGKSEKETGFYQLVVQGNTHFVLTIFDMEENSMRKLVGERTDVPEPSFFSKYGSMIIMVALFMGSKFLTNKMVPQPAAPTATATTAAATAPSQSSQ